MMGFKKYKLKYGYIFWEDLNFWHLKKIEVVILQKKPEMSSQASLVAGGGFEPPAFGL